MISIPVTAYVERFLTREYGLGPYVLDDQSRHPLRIEFLSVAAHSAIFLSPYTHASISLHIKNSPPLVNFYEANKARFERGVFGLHMFFQAMYHQVVGHFQAHPHLSDCVASFLDRYGISEDDYGQENAWRQFYRQRNHRRLGSQHFGIQYLATSIDVQIAPGIESLTLPFFLQPINREQRN